MVDKDSQEYDIYFSRIAGEKSTYKISGESSSAITTGEHSHRYTYFKMPDNMQKFLHKD